MWVRTGWRGPAWWQEVQHDDGSTYYVAYDGGGYYSIKDAANERVIKWLWRYDRLQLEILLLHVDWMFEHTDGSGDAAEILFYKLHAHFAGVRFVMPRHLRKRSLYPISIDRYVPPFPKTRRYS